MKAQLRRLHDKASRRIWAEAAEFRILRKAHREPKAPCVRRVLRLLQLMREAEQYRLQLYEHRLRLTSPDRSYSFSLEHATQKFRDPDMRALSTSYFDRLKTIEQIGKRYRWSPTLRGFSFGGLEQMVTWRKGTDNQNWENWAVYWLMAHAAHGSSGLSPSHILHFRQCGHCSKWFYAMTEHQRYCAVNCRQKSHATSTEFKEKRARYMRETYRPREKRQAKFATELAKKATKEAKHGKAT